MFRIILAALALATLAVGCGFQFKGALRVPADMERTYIATDDSHSPFYRALRAQLKAAGVDVVNSAAEATATFSILSDDTDQRVLSVSARNVPTEYEVYYSIQYAIDVGASGLMPTRQLTLTRDYTYDSRLVLGKAREQELLRDAIAEDLVAIVLKQISTL